MTARKQRRYRRLDRAERAVIERGLDKNRSAREMTRDLGRSQSSVADEVRRNRTIARRPAKGGRVESAPEAACEMDTVMGKFSDHQCVLTLYLYPTESPIHVSSTGKYEKLVDFAPNVKCLLSMPSAASVANVPVALVAGVVALFSNLTHPANGRYTAQDIKNNRSLYQKGVKVYEYLAYIKPTYSLSSWDGVSQMVGLAAFVDPSEGMHSNEHKKET